MGNHDRLHTHRPVIGPFLAPILMSIHFGIHIAAAGTHGLIALASGVVSVTWLKPKPGKRTAEVVDGE